jgi:hypothetical protein
MSRLLPAYFWSVAFHFGQTELYYRQTTLCQGSTMRVVDNYFDGSDHFDEKVYNKECPVSVATK